MIKVSRIGFINFWLYDDEEFDFYDGKLLLRGNNGSGKSVTMQSFIPLILDGNKSPARLDPFGTTDKHIEDYLLGGIDTEKKDEATAYLYMEVFHEEKKKYITIGMGLHARTGRQVDFYGFGVQDGRRIGKDLYLYKNYGEKIPLTKQELKSALGIENIIVESTKEYKKMVNNLLFGFTNLDTYDEFINVLLQLRSPKLSKDYKPTKLMSILSSVLQPLTEEDLRPLSDAIEEMDKTKEKIAKLENDSKQLSFFLKAFTNYNEILLYKKAKNFIDSNKEVLEKETYLKENEKNAQAKQAELKSILEESAELEVEQERMSRKKENFQNTDLTIKTKKLEELKIVIENEFQKLAKQETDLENKKEKEKEKESAIKKLTTELEIIEKSCLEIISDIEDLSEEIKFSEIAIALKDLKKDLTTSIDYDYLESRIKKYLQILKNIKEKIEQKEAKERNLNVVEENLSLNTKKYQEILTKIEFQEEKLDEYLSEIKDNILLLDLFGKL